MGWEILLRTSFIALAILIWLLAPAAEAGPRKPPDPPSSFEDAIKQARAQMNMVRVWLARNEASLGATDSQEIQTRLAEAEKTLGDYARLVESSTDRVKQETTPLALASASLVADDAAGIGVADDPLIPAVGLALVVTYLGAKASATHDVLQAQQRMLLSMQALLMATQVALAKKLNDGKCYCSCANKGAMGNPIKRMTRAECEVRCKSDGYDVAICK